ncbi:MAG: preprotein translocase subunit SecG [Candidatus Omnitrophica bacterium]|nr:preprotein translocase subunit SecG [Candidatus Omnitrophota bacterium]
MYALVLTIHVLVSLFLIFIILIQSSKGEGLSDVFGGGSSQTTIFGTRTGTFLTKATTVAAVVFMLTCLSLAIMSRGSGASVMQRELFRKQMEEKLKDMTQKKEPAAASADTAAESPASSVPQPRLEDKAVPAAPSSPAAAEQAAPAPAAQ